MVWQEAQHDSRAGVIVECWRSVAALMDTHAIRSLQAYRSGPKSQIVHGGRRHPATIHAAGQHRPDVLAHFLVDQPVQIGIHRHQQVSFTGIGPVMASSA